MLDVYAFATPNSVKVPIALEELGLEYRLHGINVRKGEQKTPEFVALNSNAKVPVLIDPDSSSRSVLAAQSTASFRGFFKYAKLTSLSETLEWVFQKF